MRSDKWLWKVFGKQKRLRNRLKRINKFFGKGYIKNTLSYITEVLDNMEKVFEVADSGKILLSKQIDPSIEDIYDRLHKIYANEWEVEKMVDSLNNYSRNQIATWESAAFVFSSWYICIAPAYYSLFVDFDAVRFSHLRFARRKPSDFGGVYRRLAKKAERMKRDIDPKFDFRTGPYSDLLDLLDSEVGAFTKKGRFNTFFQFSKSFRGFKAML